MVILPGGKTKRGKNKVRGLTVKQMAARLRLYRRCREVTAALQKTKRAQ
ncbi:hypothetical protein [Gelria sp. Kuro-4]|nr:hypothetical protein [Gelria sp. Kuro-4]